ncbi:MAG: hypothetical protein H7Y59_09985 [Anaerolineales bacterium]|nr:hypothetical protein [Anaerolineales bacterium]
MNTKRTLFISLISLTTILACVIPGLPTPSAPALAPTVDTGILSTMVAETVSAAIVLTEQAVPTPTLVPTSTPTSEPTLTPTAEIVPVGSTLTVQEDGSTLFIDERAGYEITVPPSWLAVRINEQEYQDALTLSADIQKSLLSIQNNDPNIFRLFAIDTQNEHVLDEFYTNINFIWEEQSTISFENNEDLNGSAVHLAEITSGLKILSSEISTISDGIPVGVIESSYIMKNSSNEDVAVFQRHIIFNTRTGAMTVTVSTLEEAKDAAFSAFDAILETIKIAPE